MDHDDTMGMLKAIAKAFDEHDLDGIMAHFADDAVFEGPRGTEPWGTRFFGREAVREALPPASPGSPTSATSRIRTSSMATAERPNGPCPERRPKASGSRSEAATCGRSARARS
jgi:SnoaL-like protein